MDKKPGRNSENLEGFYNNTLATLIVSLRTIFLCLKRQLL